MHKAVWHIGASLHCKWNQAMLFIKHLLFRSGVWYQSLWCVCFLHFRFAWKYETYEINGEVFGMDGWTFKEDVLGKAESWGKKKKASEKKHFVFGSNKSARNFCTAVQRGKGPTWNTSFQNNGQTISISITTKLLIQRFDTNFDNAHTHLSALITSSSGFSFPPVDS